MLQPSSRLPEIIDSLCRCFSVTEQTYTSTPVNSQSLCDSFSAKDPMFLYSVCVNGYPVCMSVDHMSM